MYKLVDKPVDCENTRASLKIVRTRVQACRLGVHAIYF